MGFDELIRAEIARQMGRKAVGTPTFGPPYGAGGLFGLCGFDDAVLTAFIGKGPGLIDEIPWTATLYEDERWDILTQVNPHGEAEPTTDCQTCPTCNLMTCSLHTCFGQYCRSTDELSLLKVARKAPGSTMRQLIGGIPAMPESLAWGNGQQLDVVDMLTVAMGYCLRDLVQTQAWAGNAALTAPPGYEEMNGLEILVNNGLVDALGGAACPAIDADVKDFDACIGDVGAPDIVLYMTYLYRQITRRAIKARMNPSALKLEVWMRKELWPCVAAAWPALYALLAVPVAGNTNFNHEWIFKTWEKIMDTKSLPFDQQWIPVHFDDGITGAYDGHSTRFRSDIFLLSMAYMNNPLIYGEHLDFNATIGGLAKSPLFNRWMQNGTATAIDGGRFLSIVDNVRGCLDASVYIVPRILVKAPWLCGRVTDVCCRLLQAYPGPDYPGFTPGGKKCTTPPTFYGPCDEGEGV